MVDIEWPVCIFAEALVFMGQSLEAKDLAVVGLLVVLEGVLSIDNALVLGLLAKRLPPPQRPRALSYGLIGAFVFRFLAIGLATFLLKWTFAKFLGGAYLVYIAAKHLFFESHETQDDVVVEGAEGQPELVDAKTHAPLSRAREELELKERLPFDPGDDPSAANAFSPPTSQPASVAINQSLRTFWWTVFVIEMTDIAFAVDSILAAIGVVGSPPPGTPKDATHPKMWVIILGGFLGVIVMRFAAALFIRLLEKFPRFELAAYLLVIIIGLKLLLDWAFNSDWTSWGWHANQDWARQYITWLQANWPLPISTKAAEHPHLLDFHDIYRPESLIFWVAMIAMFCVGFIPRGRK